MITEESKIDNKCCTILHAKLEAADNNDKAEDVKRLEEEKQVLLATIETDKHSLKISIII